MGFVAQSAFGQRAATIGSPSTQSCHGSGLSSGSVVFQWPAPPLAASPGPVQVQVAAGLMSKVPSNVTSSSS